MYTIRYFISCFVVFCFFIASFADTPLDLRWRLVGPMRAGWSTCAQGLPDQPDTYYFGGADGGVWKTTDSGTTWHSIADRAPFSSVGDLAVVPGGNPLPVIYVGTGQVDARYDNMDGNGMFKSEDDGETWRPIGLEQTQQIGRVLVDPRDPKTVLVAALGHVFGPGPDRGIYRSTDGGSSWQNVLFVDDRTGAVDLARDPGEPRVVYAALWQMRLYPWLSYFIPTAGPASGIWKSTDGGATWKAASRTGLPEGPLGRIGLAVAPGTHSRRVYASVSAAGAGGGLYRSDDGGDNWQLLNADWSLAGSYFGRLTADPNDSDTVYVTGQSLRVSHDGGKTFTWVKGSPGGDDYHFYWINPTDPARSILASDQGTTVTVNGGKSWTPWYNQPTGQFYHLSADERFPYWIYSGQQDTGSIGIASRTDYGQITFRDWHPVGGDERDYFIPDPDDPDIVFGSGLGGDLSKWDARTGTVQHVAPWPVSSYAARPTTTRYRYAWVTPMAISPFRPHSLFFCAQVVFRSDDKGHSWRTISPDLAGGRPEAGKECEGDVPLERTTECGYGVIHTIAVSPVRDGVIWIGTDNGRVMLTTDGGKNWENVTPKEVTDWSKIASVDASPSNPAEAVIAVDRHRLDDRAPYVYRTSDFGTSWTEISRGLPRDSYVNVVRRDPVDRDLLYAGTRSGVFVSLDAGGTWRSIQQNLPRSSVNDLLIHHNDLIAATEGRAIWILDDITPLRHARLATAAAALLVPPAPAVRVSGNENRDTPLPPEFPAAPNPPAGAVIDYFLPEGFSGSVLLEILGPEDGKVIRSLRSDSPPDQPAAARAYFPAQWQAPPPPLPAHAGHNRFVWDLRYPRPEALRYSYSMSAVAGQPALIRPLGIQVLPGKYTVRLTPAGDKPQSQPLVVRADPRSKATTADLRERFALYNQVRQALKAEIDKWKATAPAAASGSGQQQPQRPGQQGGGGIAPPPSIGVLTSLLGELERGDARPTAAQKAVFEQYTTVKPQR